MNPKMGGEKGVGTRSQSYEGRTEQNRTEQGCGIDRGDRKRRGKEKREEKSEENIERQEEHSTAYIP
jgi:hypothetical protein